MKTLTCSLITGVFLLPLLGFTSCKEPSSGSETRTDSLVLNMKEADLTSVTLSLHTAGITYPAALTLNRNSQPVQTFSLHQPDTTLLDTALTPSTGYSWQVQMKKTETAFLKSDPVTGRTMDTTSHFYSWRLDTLGHFTSFVRDVLIINDTSIWVAGQFWVDPATTADTYNAARWNGKSWKKYRFLFPNYSGIESTQLIHTMVQTRPGELKFISDIGSELTVDLSGEKIIGKSLIYARSGTPYDSWSSGDGSYYLCGSNGSLTGFANNIYTLYPVTAIRLTDITGTSNSNVWAIGYLNNNSVLLHGNQGSWGVFKEYTYSLEGYTQYPTDDLRLEFTSAWQAPGSDSLWVTTAWGVHKQSVNPGGKAKWLYHRLWDKPETNPIGFLTKIRGTGDNDVWVVGYDGTVLHFNGWSWHRYTEFNNPDFIFLALDAKKNQAIFGGRDRAGSALIIIINP